MIKGLGPSLSLKMHVLKVDGREMRHTHVEGELDTDTSDTQDSCSSFWVSKWGKKIVFPF